MIVTSSTLERERTKSFKLSNEKKSTTLSTAQTTAYTTSGNRQPFYVLECYKELNALTKRNSYYMNNGQTTSSSSALLNSNSNLTNESFLKKQIIFSTVNTFQIKNVNS
jgi:hypothetical protein